MATIVIGPPVASFCEKCGSGLGRRMRSSGISQAGVTVCARAVIGMAKTASSAATVVSFIARWAIYIPGTAVSPEFTERPHWAAARLTWPLR